MMIRRSSSIGGYAPRRSSSIASGSTASSERGYERKSSMRKRAHSVAAQVLGKSAPLASLPVLKVSVKTAFDTHVGVSLEGARPEGRGLPAVCRAGSAAVATLLAPRSLGGKVDGLKGSVEIDGFDQPTYFHIGRGGDIDSWVGSKGHWKHTVVHTESWDWKNVGPKPTEGQAADIELGGGELKIYIRSQTAVELKRCLQLQALREASEGEDYDTLRAQVTKARMASVDMEQIALGEVRLKAMRELGLHVNEGCDHATVRRNMDWALVTSKIGAPNVNEVCTVCDDCPCNVSENPGEVLEIRDGHIQEILKGFGPEPDKMLFDEIVGAALAAEEGSIWRAGGKFIFSEFNRNQSCIALERMLLKFGKNTCAKMLMELHGYTERKYNGYVTAIQVNIHHHGSYHDQHRDIYSLKQSAGPNCTCQFQECVGTVCYSLGSSRICLCETMTDTLSSIQPCGEECEGRKEYSWLHSGASMYFNGDWNNNHTHGIPPCEEDTGPRISLAFLLAAKPASGSYITK